MILIREAKPKDISAVLRLIRELADFEREPKAVVNTESELHQHIFKDKICNAIVADDNNEIIGFALYYNSYSTWKGKCLYLEDLYVQEARRKHGVGALLFEKIISIAEYQKVRRLEWLVLDWNQPAIQFYKKYGANLDNSWLNGKIEFNN
ncbi:MAG: GNAT family N-acetyltransferase [Crocinitomicaceae bacterium]|jgi:GNAT superfamily N-acetyltransferase|nr:GNAT family N-acetyltransferase [Crocinitomicaceae bacterium]